jgi:Cu2+-exporting ATPase
VGAFLAMNVMLFSLLLYADGLVGDAAAPTGLIHWVLLGLATPLLGVLGAPFLRAACDAAAQGRLTADTLVCIGTSAAYGYSAFAVVAGTGDVYFDTAAMVLVLFTLGRYLEAQGRMRAMRSLAPMLAGEQASVAVVGADDGESCQPVATVQVGDRVRIRPGERIAVDGRVVAGRSECDESILTGQPQPCPKCEGDEVIAGSLNGTGELVVCATAPGSETRWVHIGRLVREAVGRKSALGETVDRVAAWFVPGVLVLALGTGAYWAGEGGAGPALLTGLAVLVVACPCALGLAAPLASSLGIGRAAEHGILVRGGAVLERLARLRVVGFDKTGTLTIGRPVVVAVDAHEVPTAAVLRRSQQLAAGSEHPLARAIAGHAAQAEAYAPAAREIRAFRGAGVTGEVDGRCCAMGSAAFVAERVGPVPRALSDAPLPEGATAVYVGWDGRARGRLVLVDRLRPEAPAVVDALRARGLHVVLLSGDGAHAVAPLASLLAIADWHAGLTPEAKVERLQDATASLGPVAMVGDGLNDGPVLAAAAVGVAVGEASDLAKESADVVLPGGRLDLLPWVLQLAEDVRRSVQANLLWAFGYNAIALTLATCGLLRPAIAAALMAGSSLLIVARSLRAGRAVRTAASSGAAAPPPAVVPGLGLEA